MVSTHESLERAHGDFRPTGAGVAARAVAAVVILAVLVVLPLISDEVWNRRISLAAIYAIIGLSINVITGHAGQVSLGHQAFVGIGAFMSAFIATRLGAAEFAATMPTANYFMGLTASAATGAVMALLLGLVALRIRGLYLALITLAFGLMAETTVFNWEPFTGGGAGATAPRPAAFVSEGAYAYLCLLFTGLVLFIDWRLVKSKAGRAIIALRNDERVAATLGVNVTGYKLLAFVVAGTMAGLAGGLFAHRQSLVQALDFDLQTALVWVIMAVVGGLGSRAGVVIASAFFAIFPALLPATSIRLPFFGDVIVQILSPLLGATLLLLTLTLYPGGIGQQILSFRRWFAGGPLVESRHEAHRLAGFPALLGLIVGLVVTVGALGWLFGLIVSIAVAVALAVASVLGLQLYLNAYHRARRAGPARPPQPREATAPVPDAVSRDVQEATVEGTSAADEAEAPGGARGETGAGVGPAGSPSQPPEDRTDTQPIDAARGTRVARFRRRRG